jgi:putative membrane protein
MWRVTLLAGAVLAMGFAFIGTVRAADEAPAGSTAKLEKDDMKFVRSANAGGEMEVALGKLAAEKASNADVKAFGQKMVDDHSTANEELGKLAESMGVDLTMGM